MTSSATGLPRKRLEWSAQFDVAPSSKTLPGDKILLPPSALEKLLENAPRAESWSSPANASSAFDPMNPHTFAAERQYRSQFRSDQPELPYPLTFRIVNPANGRTVYAGIREFSAEEDQVGLSPFVARALDLDGFIQAKGHADDGDETMEKPRVTVHFEQLEKGTFVKLRPLEAGYDPDDWKSLLEEHMRKNFTTMTRGEVLTVTTGRDGTFQFLVDEFNPEGNAICVVDTDLEVDIEALNEDQARETLKQIAEKRLKAPGTEQGSSAGGEMGMFKPQTGQVLPGEYVDYTLPSWSRSAGLDIELDAGENAGVLDLLVSPFSSRQRAKPREDEYVFADFDDRPAKRVRLSPTNIEMEDAESLLISVHASSGPGKAAAVPIPFTLKATVADMKNGTSDDATPVPGPDEALCRNCKHVVPKQSLVLHENFCLRNNVLCPKGCGRLFQKRSPEFQEHWHCSQPGCNSVGDSEASHNKHDRIFHTPVDSCPSCPHPGPFANVPNLSSHRMTTCPGKTILCRFCHLLVPQEGDGADPTAQPDAQLLLSGLTAHELADGARTTDCHICSRPVRLRDMDTHLQNHAHERIARPAPIICRNVLCARTTHGVNKAGDTRAGTRMGQGPGNPIGVCSTCFGPLHSSMYDPDGKALQRRVERRLLQQLTGGCGKPGCENPECRTGRKNTGAGDGAALAIKDALPLVKPYVDALYQGSEGAWGGELRFCVDESMRKRRGMAEMISREGEGQFGIKRYGLPWCIGALEAEGGDIGKARTWLENYGVTLEEEASRR